MKKLFLTIMVVVGLAGIEIIADDTVTINGTVEPSAVVGFSDVSGETLTDVDRFLDATIDMGESEPNEGFTTTASHFYVKSNNPNGVQVSITPHTGENSSGFLTRESGTEVLSATYYIGTGFGGQYSMSSSPVVALTTEATNGSEEGISFFISPSIPDTHIAGVYNTVLDVTVICP